MTWYLDTLLRFLVGWATFTVGFYVWKVYVGKRTRYELKCSTCGAHWDAPFPICATEQLTTCPDCKTIDIHLDGLTVMRPWQKIR